MLHHHVTNEFSKSNPPRTTIKDVKPLLISTAVLCVGIAIAFFQHY